MMTKIVVSVNSFIFWVVSHNRMDVQKPLAVMNELFIPAVAIQLQELTIIRRTKTAELQEFL